MMLINAECLSLGPTDLLYSTSRRPLSSIYLLCCCSRPSRAHEPHGRVGYQRLPDCVIVYNNLMMTSPWLILTGCPPLPPDHHTLSLNTRSRDIMFARSRQVFRLAATPHSQSTVYILTTSVAYRRFLGLLYNFTLTLVHNYRDCFRWKYTFVGPSEPSTVTGF